jgi:hypothetical protein
VRQPDWSVALLEPVLAIDDDEARLNALAVAVGEAEAHLDAARGARNYCAGRLRREGVAMVDIAKWARVTDSYLSRMLLKRGAARRTSRRR